MRLATRFFLSTSLLVAATVLGLTLAADRILRDQLEAQTAQGLEREARLVDLLVPADTTDWPALAIRLGALIGHRVTLIDTTGRVRGDTEFPADALPRLENHAHRPEVMAAVTAGVGESKRYSVSTDLNRMYMAIRSRVPGLLVVRVSTTLAAVDAQIDAVQHAVWVSGLVAIGLAALLAWVGSGYYARPTARPHECGASHRRRAAARVPRQPHPGNRPACARAAGHERRAGRALRRPAPGA